MWEPWKVWLAELQYLMALRTKRLRDESYSVCCSESGNRTMAVTKEGLCFSEAVMTASYIKGHTQQKDDITH